MAKFLCKVCGQYHVLKPGPVAVAFDCSGADAGAIGRGAISAGPSVPGDSLRKIRELIDEEEDFVRKGLWMMARMRRDQIRDICSNENRSGMET